MTTSTSTDDSGYSGEPLTRGHHALNVVPTASALPSHYSKGTETSSKDSNLKPPTVRSILLGIQSQSSEHDYYTAAFWEEATKALVLLDQAEGKLGRTV